MIINSTIPYNLRTQEPPLHHKIPQPFKYILYIARHLSKYVPHDWLRKISGVNVEKDVILYITEDGNGINVYCIHLNSRNVSKIYTSKKTLLEFINYIKMDQSFKQQIRYVYYVNETMDGNIISESLKKLFGQTFPGILTPFINTFTFLSLAAMTVLQPDIDQMVLVVCATEVSYEIVELFYDDNSYVLRAIRHVQCDKIMISDATEIRQQIFGNCKPDRIITLKKFKTSKCQTRFERLLYIHLFNEREIIIELNEGYESYIATAIIEMVENFEMSVIDSATANGNMDKMMTLPFINVDSREAANNPEIDMFHDIPLL